MKREELYDSFNSNKMLSIDDIIQILSNYSEWDILDSITPEIMRKIIDLVSLTKRRIIPETLSYVGRNAWYNKMDKNERMDFICWLDDARAEYKEDINIQVEAQEKISTLADLQGTTKKTCVRYKPYDVGINDWQQGDLFHWLENSYQEYQQLCESGCDPRESYVKPNTWYGIFNRDERIAFVSWLKKEHESFQRHNKTMNALCEELRAKPKKAIRSQDDIEADRAYYALQECEYYRSLGHDIPQEKIDGLKARIEELRSRKVNKPESEA